MILVGSHYRIVSGTKLCTFQYILRYCQSHGSGIHSHSLRQSEMDPGIPIPNTQNVTISVPSEMDFLWEMLRFTNSIATGSYHHHSRNNLITEHSVTIDEILMLIRRNEGMSLQNCIRIPNDDKHEHIQSDIDLMVSK